MPPVSAYGFRAVSQRSRLDRCYALKRGVVLAQRIEHPRFGCGEVEASRHGGLDLLVRFEDGVRRWVRLDEVRVLAATPLPPSPTRRQPALSEDAFRARAMIESFRLGIVPVEYVRDFTFGRDHEIGEFQSWLKDDRTGTLAVVGQYGSGKTHLLEHMYATAVREGYAAARVQLDAGETPFHRPKRVYAGLVRTLRFEQNGAVLHFRDLIAKVRESRQSLDHAYLKYMTCAWSADEIDEERWYWLEGGESLCYPRLYDVSTGANIYCYLLSGLSWAARSCSGLKGLVVLLDEAESIDISWYKYQFEKGRNFLKALLLVAANDERLRNVPSSTGLDYCGWRPDIPFAYQLPTRLKVVVAFTPSDTLDTFEPLQQARRIDLDSLSDRVLRDVFEHICLLYAEAYEYLESDPVVDRIFERLQDRQGGRTRMFVKSCIEVLDLARHGML
jgi:hypothetical protein